MQQVICETRKIKNMGPKARGGGVTKLEKKNAEKEILVATGDKIAME